MAAQEVARAFRQTVCAGAVEQVGAMLDEDNRLLEAPLPGGFRPLMAATYRGHVDVVRLLLGRGADIDAADGRGRTALYWAVLSVQEEVVDVLLTFGADASRVMSRGHSPLILASADGVLGIVKRLLQSLGGQGLDAQEANGSTAFYVACLHGHEDIARVLLLEGADYAIADHDGTTPRMVAESEGHDQCVALIQWWEGELERAYVVHKARRGLEVPATWQAPGAPVPAYLRARAQGNKRVPQVHLRGLGSSGGRVTRGAARRIREEGGEGPCEGEKDATLQYVMHDLAPELYIELMAGFR